MNKLFISFLLLIFCLYGHSQQRFFSGYSISDGLSQSVVNCIFQDSRGFMWFGTQNGLNRFDGYSFEVFIYKPNDTTSISNNWIYSITEDKQGNLWIGTKGGLNRYLFKEKRFERIHYSTPYAGNITEYIYDVKTAGDGTILINTPPVLSICDPEKLSFRHFLSPVPIDESIKDWNIPLLIDPDHKIWIGSPNGLACFTPDSGKFEVFARDLPGSLNPGNQLISALFRDKQGNLWIGTPSGLYRYRENDKSFLQYKNIPGNSNYLINNTVRAITADSSGNLWIATEGGGLNVLMKDYNRNEVLERFTEENSAIAHNIILSLFPDRSGNLWIGTLSGVSRTDLKKQKFNLYRNSGSPSSVDLAGNIIASVYKDEKGKLWIGNWGQGFNIFDRSTGKVEHFSSHHSGKNYIPDNYVHSIFKDDKDMLWIGTRDGLLVWQEKSGSFIRPSSFSGNPALPDFRGLRIFTMIQDRLKNYWVATQNGLFKVNPLQRQTSRFHATAQEQYRISGNLVYDVLEDSHSLIWIATTEGLDLLNPATGSIRHFGKSEGGDKALSDDFVTSLCEDQSGDIWIGTSSYIDRFSKNDSSFTWYTQEHGLPGNLVYSIQRDKSNGIWVATGNGLCHFDPKPGTFHTFSVEDGMQSPEFNLNASFVSDDGEVFFGGMNGLNAFYPDSLRNNPYIPPVVITSVYKIKKGIREYINVEKTNRLVLPHNENSLTIEFAALEFTHPSKNRYMYHFEGMDEEWIDIGTRRFVSFYNLSSGEYRLRIRGSNSDGLWNEQGATLHIVVKAPWWMSNLAMLSYIVAALLVVLTLFKRREHKHLSDKRLLEEKVSERTRQIEEQKSEILNKNKELHELNASKDKFFSIIAHDLRNPFNTIIGLSEVLLMNMESTEPGKMRKSLENIKDSSHQAYELLENLLLWARSQTGTMVFHPEPVDMRTVIEEGLSLVEAHAVKKNISITAEIKEDLVVPGDINMIRTILRNLLTNALKFTPQNGKVMVDLSETDGFCRICVKDNGLGIEQETLKKLFEIDSSHKTRGTAKEPGSGLGLILCQEFVSKHQGRIEVESEPGKGSEFRVLLPLRER